MNKIPQRVLGSSNIRGGEVWGVWGTVGSWFGSCRPQVRTLDPAQCCNPNPPETCGQILILEPLLRQSKWDTV